MEGMSKTMAARRAKWKYPQPPPTPRILHLPRRPRRKQTKASPAKPTSQREKKGRLEMLFDQERSLARGVMPVVFVRPGETGERRERVEEVESGVVAVEERWRFQAEILRAECNLLRMEREIAIKKMERRRAQMERMLRSTIQTLVSGRKKISKGENVTLVLEEEIIELVEKLKKLQKQSDVKDSECKNCSDFDKQASFLQRRLEKFGGMLDEEMCIKEIREMAVATLSIKTNLQDDEGFLSNQISNVEILREKMEGLSKGMLLERMVEEYGSMLSTSNGSTVSSASNSKRMEFPDMSMLSIQHPYKLEEMPREGKSCSGCCKAMVRTILEQVCAETEQWSQMQEMLGQVRDEIEELQASRDFWEDRAIDSNNQIQSLQYNVKEWKQKAVSSEAKANELQEQVSMLHGEIERLRKVKEREALRARNLSILLQQVQKNAEKQALVCHLKENCHSKIDIRRRAQTSSGTGLVLPKCSPLTLPLREIGNMSSLMRHQSKAIVAVDHNCKENVR